jgi:hypothetical protein
MAPSNPVPQGWDSVLQLRYRLYLPSILGLSTLAVFDAIRSLVWRNTLYGPQTLKDYAAQDILAAQPSQTDLARITGVGRGRIYTALKALEDIGWIERVQVRNAKTMALESNIYVLGKIVPDIVGGTESLLAHTVMQRWYEEIDRRCRSSKKTAFKSLPPDTQKAMVETYLQKRHPTPRPTLQDVVAPNGGHLDVVVHGSSVGQKGTLPVVEGSETRTQGVVAPNGGYPVSVGLGARGGLEKSGNRPESLEKSGVVRTYIHKKNSSTSLRSTLRTSYSESSSTQCSSSGLAPQHTLSSRGTSLGPKGNNPERPTDTTTLPVPVAPPSLEASVGELGGRVIHLPTTGAMTMAMRRTETGSGATKGRWGGTDPSEDSRERSRAVSAPRCFQPKEPTLVMPDVEAPPAAPANKPLKAGNPLAEVRALVDVTKAAADKSRVEKLIRKERSKERRTAARAVDNSYTGQVSNAGRLERVWRDEMTLAFPDIPQIAWFKTERGRTTARKEGKLAADLLDGYGGDYEVVKGLVEAFIQNWDAFGPMLTKQDDSVPTFGLFFACHATVAAESGKMRKRKVVIEQYREWERANAGDAFAVPPAELLAAYKAATTVKKGGR